MKIIKTPNERRNLTEQLLKEIRDTAYESARSLWSEVLEAVEDVNVLWGMVKGLKQLTTGKDYNGAMDILRVLYSLSGEELPEQAATYAEHHALLCMFLDEFLVETDELLMDWELRAVTDFLNGMDN